MVVDFVGLGFAGVVRNRRCCTEHAFEHRAAREDKSSEPDDQEIDQQQEDGVEEQVSKDDCRIAQDDQHERSHGNRQGREEGSQARLL